LGDPDLYERCIAKGEPAGWTWGPAGAWSTGVGRSPGCVRRAMRGYLRSRRSLFIPEQL